MKQAIITILFILAVPLAPWRGVRGEASVQAKTYKTIKAPEWMACVNVRGDGLKACEVVFRDTATTVHFSMEYPKGQYYRFVKGSYLMDEDGHRYPLRSAEGIELDTWVQ